MRTFVGRKNKGYGQSNPAAAGAVVAKQLPLHLAAARQPLEASWEKGMFIPHNKSTGRAMGLLAPV